MRRPRASNQGEAGEDRVPDFVLELELGQDHGKIVIGIDEAGRAPLAGPVTAGAAWLRSEEHTSELQSLMRISYAVFCLKKKKTYPHTPHHTHAQQASAPT